MKRCILVLMLILCCYCVTAKTSVFNNWVSDDSHITLNEQTYNISISANSRQVYISGPREAVFVTREDCVSDIYHEFCYNDNRTASYDLDTDRYIQEGSITVYSLLPDLTLNLATDITDNKYFEDVIITATIVNIGDKDAQNVKFLMAIPDGLNIRKALDSKIDIIGKNVIWTGNLANGLETEFSFSVFAITDFDQTLIANLTYHYEEFNFSETDDIALTADMDDIITIVQEFQEDSIDIDEEDYLILNITNDYEADLITINRIIFNIPEALEFVESNLDIYKVEGTKHHFRRAQIPAQDSYFYKIYVKGVLPGTHNVTAELQDVYIQGISIGDLLNQSDSIIVARPSLITPEIVLSENTTMISNQFGNVKFLITNNNSNAKFYNISSYLRSNMTESKSYFAHVLPSNKRYLVSDINIRAPVVLKTEKFYINFSGDYTTSFNTTESFNSSVIIRVRPLPNQTWNITKTFTPTTVLKGGDNVTMTVRIKNVGGKILNDVDAHESYPSDFRRYRGDAYEYNMRFLPNDDVALFDYSLVVPYKIPGEKVPIITNVDYNYEGERLTETKEIILTLERPAVPDLQVTRTIRPLTVGNTSVITYNFTNKHTDELKNIFIDVFKLYEIDQVDSTSVSVSSIQAGATLLYNFTLRSKLAGEIVIPAEQADFEDKYGNVFNKSISAETITIADAKILDAAILIKREHPFDAVFNETIEVKTEYKNIGNDSAIVEGIILNPNEVHSLTHQIPAALIPKYATAAYNVSDKSMYAYSDKLNITLTHPVKEIMVNITDNATSVNETVETIDETPKPGFFRRIINWFKNLFN